MQEAAGSFENKLLSSALSEFPGRVSVTKALCNPNILQLLPDLATEPGLWASPRPPHWSSSSLLPACAPEPMPRLPVLPAH